MIIPRVSTSLREHKEEVKVGKVGIVSLSFLSLFVCICLALVSNETLANLFEHLKYPVLLVCAVIFFLSSKIYFVGVVSAASYLFFLFFTLFFTVFNSPDLDSVLAFFGYMVLLVFWGCSQTRFGFRWYVSFFSSTIFYLVWAHVILSAVFVLSPSAYSIGKGQFSAYMTNPNAYAGLTGLFLVLAMSRLTSLYRREFVVNAFLCLLLGVFLILSGSRATLLSAFVAFLVTHNKLSWKVTALVVGAALAVLIYFSSYFDSVLGYTILNRDLLEDTGRGRRLDLYLGQILENSFIFGTGLSEEGGRIKSDLAYMDVILFSGIGSIGFFLFLGLGFYHAIKAAVRGYLFLLPILVYVILLSLFEGYLANVVTVPTIVFYIFHGVSLAVSKGGVKDHSMTKT